MSERAKTVVVTGGGTGIGRAVAAAFVTEGARVVITGRRAVPLKEAAAALGSQVRPWVGDMTDPHAVAEFAATVEDVDVVVNNAGGNTDFTRPVAEDLATLADNWRANLDSNLISPVLVTTALRDKIRTGGTVITIGSVAADKGVGSYGAAKAGVASWNIEMARTLGPHGVTANVVSPGYIAETEFFGDRLTAQDRASMAAATATGRTGAPTDIAGTVLFLASPAARHITGQVLAVNGGEVTTR